MLIYSIILQLGPNADVSALHTEASLPDRQILQRQICLFGSPQCFLSPSIHPSSSHLSSAWSQRGPCLSQTAPGTGDTLDGAPVCKTLLYVVSRGYFLFHSYWVTVSVTLLC